MSVHGFSPPVISQRAPKLFTLGEASEGRLLIDNQVFELKKGVMASFDPPTHSILIEIFEKNIEVKINGQTISDLGHLKMGQTLEVGEASFVFLGHLQVHLLDQVQQDAMLLPPPETREIKKNFLYLPSKIVLSSTLLLTFLVALNYYLASSHANESLQDASIHEQETSKTTAENHPPQEPSPAAADSAKQEAEALPNNADLDGSPEMPKKPILSESQIRKIRSQAEAIKLEGRFDPQTARRKIAQLEKTVPEAHSLRLELEILREQIQ